MNVLFNYGYKDPEIISVFYNYVTFVDVHSDSVTKHADDYDVTEIKDVDQKNTHPTFEENDQFKVGDFNKSYLIQGI